MKLYTLLILLAMSIQTTALFEFNADTKASSWQIVNDGVMGGLSSSSIQISAEGHGVFEGHVSLANNGGFASVRHNNNFENIDDYSHVVLKLKGDGKNYQFRLKASNEQRQSYVQEIETTGEWQEIKLKLSDFKPQFRGAKLNMPNFDFDTISEMAFLIGNKKEEDFKLIIHRISLE
jgi:hypothetical protein